MFESVWVPAEHQPLCLQCTLASCKDHLPACLLFGQGGPLHAQAEALRALRNNGENQRRHRERMRQRYHDRKAQGGASG